MQNLKFLTLQLFRLPNGLLAYQPASQLAIIMPSFIMARVSVFHTIKAIISDLWNCYSKESLSAAPWCFLLSNFHFQIAYRNMRNLQIGVNKLVVNVSINFLHHVEFIMSWKVSNCVISIIIDVLSVKLSKLYTKRNWFNKCFLLLQLPYCVSVLLLTSGCKSAPAQCKC